MKKYSRILIAVNLILLLGYFNWSVYQKEKTLKNGKLILMRLAPVDPRSLMQGDYMQLNYEESNTDFTATESPSRGYAVLELDSNRVGRIVRLQKSFQPISEGQLAVKYRKIYQNLQLGAESFFFEEGQDSVYSAAVYGGLRADDKGESILVGLYDKDFRQIRAKRTK